MTHASQIQIGGRVVPVSRLDKIFYPPNAFTKGQVIDYYIHVAPWLLPHLSHRPVTLKRYPDGVEGGFFYEKQCPAHRPDWVKTVKVAKSSGVIDYCVIDSLPSLIWVSNLANLELHTFLHVAPRLTRPKVVVFDLDPGEPADIIDCCKVAINLRKLFEKLNLDCFPKTSGSKGLQIYLPVNSPCTYAKTKSFSRDVAEAMEEMFPETVVARMSKVLRRGKVFIDWSQNDEHKTTVNVYSLRAKEFPSVSTPLSWREVAAAAKQGKREKLFFSPGALLTRVKKLGDLFAPVLTLKQTLP